MNKGKEKKKIPWGEGRLRISPDGKASLIGMKCKGCGEVIFPQKVPCPNCWHKDIEELILSNKGKIWSYTVVYESYGNILGLESPYVTAFVELPEGAYVHTPILGCAPEDVKIGMEVELDLIKADESDEYEKVTYVFKPASAPSGD